MNDLGINDLMAGFLELFTRTLDAYEIAVRELAEAQRALAVEQARSEHWFRVAHGIDDIAKTSEN